MLFDLAQAAPAMPDVDPRFFKDFMSVLAFVLGLGGVAYGVISKKTTHIGPQPLEVTPSAEYVTKSEYAEFKRQQRDQFAGLESEIRDSFKDLKSARSEDIANLHKHMESLVGKVEGHFKDIQTLHQDSMTAAFERVNNVADRVSSVEGQLKAKGARS